MRKVKAFVPFLRNIYKVLKSDGYYRGWHTERERERENLDVTSDCWYNVVCALCSKSFDICAEHDKSAHDWKRDESTIPEERCKKTHYAFLEKLWEDYV